MDVNQEDGKDIFRSQPSLAARFILLDNLILQDFAPILLEGRTRRRSTAADTEKISKPKFPILVIEQVGEKKNEILVKENEDLDAKIARESLLAENVYDEIATDQDNKAKSSVKQLTCNRMTGETVLHKAARLGYDDIVVIKIKEGADVNARDNAGWTALHESCSRGMTDVVRVLLKYGADPNSCSETGIRPIHDAVDSGNIEVIRLLLRYGADVSTETYSGLKILQLARTEATKDYIISYARDIQENSVLENAEKYTQDSWNFRGSSHVMDSAKDDADEIFSDFPADSDRLVEFETSKVPLPPCFNLPVYNEADHTIGYRNYYKLEDVLEAINTTRHVFLRKHKVELRQMPLAEFVEHIQKMPLTSGSNSCSIDSNTESQLVELVHLGPFTAKKIFDLKTYSYINSSREVRLCAEPIERAIWPARPLHLQVVTGKASSQVFVSTPANPTYAVKGGSVSLNWTYSANSVPVMKRWFQSTSSGTAINGELIMRTVQTNPPEVMTPSFVGRASYFGNGGLTITNVLLTDAGLINFDATFGKILQNMIMLIVTIPPEVATGLVNETIVSEREKSILECAFDARPAPTILWYLNGIAMNNARYNISTTISDGSIANTTRAISKLTINSSMPEDTGVISCVAMLPNANVSSQTNHIVLYEPRGTKFTSDKPNHVGGLGLAATFTCSAHGNPLIFYQIFKNGLLLRNSTSGILNLASVSLSDEGTYSCIPINNLVVPTLVSSTSSPFEDITRIPLVLSCVFYGEPTPNITWRRFHRGISSAANITTTVLSTNASFSVVESLLTFTTSKKTDYGVYECKAQNMAGFMVQNISVDVQYSANLNRSLKQNYTLVEDFGRNESWRCKAEGNPEVEIVWLLNGKQLPSEFVIAEKKKRISSSNHFEVESMLTMISINRINAGLLTCNASNIIGYQESTTVVIIQYIPTSNIALFSSETNLTESSSVTFVCDINSMPQPDVYFTKDGKRLNNSDYMMSESVSYISSLAVHVQKNLTLANANRSDYGVYQCIAVNIIGNLTQQTLLNVMFKVEFLTSLAPVARVEDGASHFKIQCSAIGNPEPRISWYFNGTFMRNNSDVDIIQWFDRRAAMSQITSIVNLKRIKLTSYGNYSCVASNAIGSISSRQLLIVNYQPLILQSTPNLVITNASITVRLFCEVKSNPLATVYWRVEDQRQGGLTYTNNSYILLASSRETSIRTDLVIANSTLYDNGVYFCVANNSIGTAIHNTTLVVQYSPLNLTTLLTKYEVRENEPFSLHCAFVSNPQSNIVWKYNGLLLRNTTARNEFNESLFIHDKSFDRTISNSSIKINSIKRQFRGEYECSAGNHQGMLALKTTIVVHYEPTFQSRAISTIILNSKDNVTFRCQVESYPQSTITWLKDNEVLHNNTKTRILIHTQYKDDFKAVVSSTLQLNAINKSDTGNYSCKATNNLASKHQTTRLIVRYLPEIAADFGSQQNLTESLMPLDFTCTVESHPMSSIQWFKDGLPYNVNITTVTNTSTDSKTVIESKLTFSNGIKRDNFGFYVCQASNVLGNSSKSTNVTVWYGPESHSNLAGQVNVTKLRNVSFECIVEGNPSPVIQWFRNNMKITFNRFIISTGTVQSTPSRSVVRSLISVLSVVKNDTATYKCMAQSIVRIKNESIFLNVEYRPQLLVKSANLTTNKSKEVNLDCLVDANPSIVSYNWTKDGQPLNHNGRRYTIASAEGSSTGIYRCTPSNNIGIGEAVIFGLLVQIPPTFTSNADCKPNRIIKMMTCTCAGQGVPSPYLYWTKDSDPTEISNSGNFQRSLTSRNIDGKYHCHLRNILKEVSRRHLLGSLGANATSAADLVSKVACELAIFKVVLSILKKAKTALLFVVIPPAKQTDEPWAIALYVLIPFFFVVLVLVACWFGRTYRRKSAEDALVIPVNDNLAKPPAVRSVPTRRDIYLPEKNFGSVNPAYFVEENEVQHSRDQATYKNDKNENENKNGAIDRDEKEMKVMPVSTQESSTDENEHMQMETGKTSPTSINSNSKDNNAETNEVATYLGPNGQTISYSVYDEMSTSL
eukprot:gene11406-12594_t